MAETTVIRSFSVNIYGLQFRPLLQLVKNKVVFNSTRLVGFSVNLLLYNGPGKKIQICYKFCRKSQRSGIYAKTLFMTVITKYKKRTVWGREITSKIRI